MERQSMVKHIGPIAHGYGQSTSDCDKAVTQNLLKKMRSKIKHYEKICSAQNLDTCTRTQC